MSSVPSHDHAVRRFWIGIAMLLGAAVCFALHNVFTKLSLAPDVKTSAWTILTVRSWLAVLLFTGILWATRTPVLTLPRAAFWVLALATFCNVTQNPAIVLSFKFIDVSLAVLIVYLFPIIVAIMAITLGGERATLPVLGGAAFGFAGVALVLHEAPDRVDWRGIALAVYVAVALATNVFYSARLGRHMAPMAVPFVYSIAGAPLFTIVMLAGGGRGGPPGPGAWVFAVAVISLPLALMLFYGALPRAGAPRAAVIMNAEPLLTVAMAAAFAAEILEPMQILGGGLILMAIFWITLGGKHEAPAKGGPG